MQYVRIAMIIGGFVLFLALITPLAQLQGEIGLMYRRALVWLASCAVLVLMQRKDWLNHVYPMVFMAGLALVFALYYLAGNVRELKMDVGHAKFAAACMALAALVTSGVVSSQLLGRVWAKPSRANMQIAAAIHQYAVDKPVYPLSFNLLAGFPVILNSQAVYHGSFQHLWPLPGLIIRKNEDTPGLAAARTFFFDRLVKDFTDIPPKLVWVDENVGLENIAGYAITPQDRDIITVLTRDKRFAALWKHYRNIGYVEGEQDQTDPTKKPERFTLYLRKPPQEKP